LFQQYSSFSANFTAALPFKLLNRLNAMPVWREHMLWTIFAILIVLWLLGWGFHVAGSLIHLLLVVALVIAVVNLLTGRRAV
jgi:DMSO reductase anchor subunit